MSISMYQTSVPIFIRMLGNLNQILEKAAAHAEKKGFNPQNLVNYRLYPDMLPLSSQIQIATDTVKGCVARLSGQQPPVFEDNEATLAELSARINKTIDYVKTFTSEQIDGTEEKTIQLKLGSYTPTFTGQRYLLHFVLPNLYFHITTAYAILRHNGVEIGKADYLGVE
ncbi:uncharacterized protein conserved in bacteria [Hahella chejuensis KCTC 2396]|uniref:Uncharacterized protein conserved in bacteria n=1 Tax=Hahella chejuensis (strain KCTC 2396) TaxID=349521 RepID=Q2SPJ8_HAHCH|nr:DUF1993 domain-containing protein [Hahella chejuensis]ABC27426.1 uncharacterized protein conserved in bacteria [Hahella chejuensis KCTC 2396]